MRTLLLSVDAPKTIDYMSLDVEGAETSVMQGFPFDAGFTIRVLSVERPDVALEQLLVENGMIRVGAIGRMGEVIFIKASDVDVASRARKLAETISKSTPFYPGLSDGSNLIFPGACGWTKNSVIKRRRWHNLRGGNELHGDIDY